MQKEKKFRSREFDFTPENLLDNQNKLGGWSTYHLASVALEYYFPKEYEYESPSTNREIELLESLGFEYWNDVIVKYHKEVGYTDKQLADQDYVNER